MRLGAPILRPFADAQQWIGIVKEKGYRAVFSPLKGDEGDAVVDSYAAAAREAGVLIAWAPTAVFPCPARAAKTGTLPPKRTCPRIFSR